MKDIVKELVEVKKEVAKLRKEIKSLKDEIEILRNNDKPSGTWQGVTQEFLNKS